MYFTRWRLISVAWNYFKCNAAASVTKQFLQILDRLRAHIQAVYLANLVAHVKRALAMDHAADEDASDDDSIVVGQLERNAHRLVRILLKLN